MLSLGFSMHDVARTRITISCLWEVMASVRVLGDPASHPVHLPWVNQVRPRLAAAGFLPGAGHRWLTSLVPPNGHPIPDFLTPPPPATATADLATELSALAATSAEVVRADLKVLDQPRLSALQGLCDDPKSGLARLVDEITEYWDIALAQSWPRIRTLLDAEVFQRARRLTEDGAEGLLNDLHQRVHWRDGSLSIAPRRPARHRRRAPCAAPAAPR
ncbi:hypothetical protein [Plantactinospora sp. DSM 117369]